MLYYHGTTIGNLDYLIPFNNPNSNLKKSCIYFTTKEEIAVMYIWKYSYKFLTYEYDESGNVYYYEWFDNAIDYFYKGLKGFVYLFDGKLDYDENIKIKYAAISERPIKVDKYISIADVSEKLKEYNEKGQIKIIWYKDLSADKEAIYRKIMKKEIEKCNDDNQLKNDFFQQKFPDIWDEVNKEKNRTIALT
jgi:hypothetical protein